MKTSIFAKISLIKTLAAIGSTCSILAYKISNNFFHVNAEDTYSYCVPQKTTIWNYNWDNRHSESCECKSIAKRNIFLIRHGKHTKPSGFLSKKGKKQSEFTAMRLMQLGHNYNKKLYCSNYLRCIDTAEIIANKIRRLEVDSYDELGEGVPFYPEPESDSSFAPLTKVIKDGERIDRAFDRFFYRADPEQIEDSFDIIVGNSNVLRYFVCRALQLPLEGWNRFSWALGGITWIVIYPDGRVEMNALGDAEFMPKEYFAIS